MDNNISELLSKEIEELMKSKFFFRVPSNIKVLAYSVRYLFLILLGVFLNIEVVTAFLSVFPLTYALGARGLKYYISLIISGGIILVLFASPNMIVWFGIHMVIAYIVYKTIYVRGSKIFLVVAVSSLIFLAVSMYIFLSIRLGHITIDSKQILDFINSYVNSMSEMNQSVDKNMVLESFSNLQKSFPVTLFVVIFVYGLVLVQYTLTLLGREYVIIPVFPKFSRIMLSPRSGYIYISITLLTFFVEMGTESNTYSFWNILFQNLTGLLSLVFILNGLFTAFFFIEQKSNSKIPIGKPVVFALMFIFSPIFELLGFVDSIFKLREGYIVMRKGR